MSERSRSRCNLTTPRTPPRFAGTALPLLLISPQLLLTVTFFLWPLAEACRESVTAADPFGQVQRFVGLGNFVLVLTDPLYLQTIFWTLLYCLAVSLLATASGLFFAYCLGGEWRGQRFAAIIMLWPYAVAPAMAGVIWAFIADPQTGVLGRFLGPGWDYLHHAGQARALVIGVAAWKQTAYDFLFYAAALYAIPRDVIEAARLDGARGVTLFRTMIWPLLWPLTSVLLAVNAIYAAFDTFGIIAALTGGGPAGATRTVVLSIYQNGYLDQNIGISAAESVLLLGFVVAVAASPLRQWRGRRAA